MIIPIGVDCGMAEFCKKYGLRTMAFPFDWNVTYNGVSACIGDSFNHFTDPLHDKFNEYGMYFTHDFENDSVNQDREKYTRRCQRLMNILESSKEIIFCRKGHASHNHSDHSEKGITIANDIDDAEQLNIILKNKYPHLKYKIIVILVCGTCFNSMETYKSVSDTIEIHNIATPQADDLLFENCCRGIFNV